MQKENKELREMLDQAGIPYAKSEVFSEIPASSAEYDLDQGAESINRWKRHEGFYASDVTGTLHIVLADGVYIDALNLKPRLQNQIRCMAAFDNPIFYKINVSVIQTIIISVQFILEWMLMGTLKFQEGY